MHTPVSRRSLIKLLAAAAPAVSFLPQFSPRRSTPSGRLLSYALFFDESDVDRIRSAYFNNPVFESVRSALESIDADETRNFLRTEVRFNDQLYDIARVGTLLEELSFRFLMNGDELSRDLAIECGDTIMKFDRWDFFLDGDKPIAVQRASQSTISISLGADWLGASLPEEQRRAWLQTMGERGCQACYNSLYIIANPHATTDWRFDPESTYFEHRPDNRTDMNRRAEITQDTNLRAVPASAILIGTTAYEFEFGSSEKTQRWMNVGAEAVRAFKPLFQADGSYHEEISYAHYTATHVAQAAIVTARTGSVDLTDTVNWDRYADFQLNMTMPTRGDRYSVVNFGDSGNHSFNEPARAALPGWIAARSQNTTAQWYADNLAGTRTIWDVIWRDNSLEGRPPVDGNKLWISELDRVVARTGWDEDALVVAMRSGGPANHEHADRNSIIVKSHGEVLVSDPLRPPYSFADPAWPMRLSVGHSGVLIDGRGHQHHNGVEGTNASRALARIVHSDVNTHQANWTSNATQAYRLVDTNIKGVFRSIAVLFEPQVIVVVDSVSKYVQPSRLTARFFGFNEDGNYGVTIGDGRFIVRRPNAVMRAEVLSELGHRIVRGEPFVPEETAKLHPFVDVVTDPAEDILLVTVLSVGTSESTLPTIDTSFSNGSHTIRVGGQTVVASRGGLRVS